MGEASPGPFLDTSGNGRHTSGLTQWVFQEPAITPFQVGLSARKSVIDYAASIVIPAFTWCAQSFTVEVTIAPNGPQTTGAPQIANTRVTNVNTAHFSITYVGTDLQVGVVTASPHVQVNAVIPLGVHNWDDGVVRCVCDWFGTGTVEAWWNDILIASQALPRPANTPASTRLGLGGNAVAFNNRRFDGRLSHFRYWSHAERPITPSRRGFRHVGLVRGARG